MPGALQDPQVRRDFGPRPRFLRFLPSTTSWQEDSLEAKWYKNIRKHKETINTCKYASQKQSSSSLNQFSSRLTVFLHPRLHCRHFVCFVRANSIILSHLLMYKNPLKKCTVPFLGKNCWWFHRLGAQVKHSLSFTFCSSQHKWQVQV